MPTYTPLQSIVLTSSTASVTLSSIPQTYQDLVLVIQGQDTGNDNQYFRLNGDTNSNYSFTSLNGTGSATNTNRVTNATAGRFAWYAAPNPSNNAWISRINFMNYSNSNTSKIILGRTDVSLTYPGTEATANRWNNTSAITSITLYWGSTDTWAAGTTFDLYGIRSGSAKASGGEVTTDGTYWYHTFKNSGLFVTNQAISVDYLVVAGGGGGSYRMSGGAGAGGLRSTVTATGGGASLENALSLPSSTSYAITVGAGGTGGIIGNGVGTVGNNSIFSTITSIGGGYPGSDSGAGTPSSGGSGGGGSIYNNGGSGTAGQGYAGGNGNGYLGSGGGGGAGAVGSNAAVGSNGNSGSGGNGVAVSISGSSVTYAGGGGGGAPSNYTAGAGGTGGGGAGATGTNVGTAGTANTGGGGGGGGTSSGGGSPFGNGGNGGSGIIILRYAV